MRTKINLIVLAVSLGMFSHFTYAQTGEQEENKTKFSFEIDPATFAFGGYSAHLRIQPKNSKHYLFGFGVYAMDLPDPFVNINKNNRDEGWKVRINQGYGLFGEHHFTEVNKKWFVGSQLSVQEFKIEKDFTDGNEKFTNLLFMVYGGYTWKPFKNNLYLKPWGGVGYTTKISGENTLGNNEYDISPISVFATLHIGYTF